VIQDAIRVGQLTTGHAKLLKGVPDRERQISLTREIIARGLSVHATEALLKQPAASDRPDTSDRQEHTAPQKTRHVLGIEDELRQKLGVRLEIKLKAKDRGQIVLSFESNDDFERLVEVLRR
jgi:ParB family chromosome partitioning protein